MADDGATEQPLLLTMPPEVLCVILASACGGVALVPGQAPVVRAGPRALLVLLRRAYCTVQRLRRVCRATATAEWLPDEWTLFWWLYENWESACVCSPARSVRWSAESLLSGNDRRLAAWLPHHLTRETASGALKLALGQRPSSILRVRTYFQLGKKQRASARAHATAHADLYAYLADESEHERDTLFLDVPDFRACPAGGLVPLSAAHIVPWDDDDDGDDTTAADRPLAATRVKIRHPEDRTARPLTVTLDVCATFVVELLPAVESPEHSFVPGRRRIVRFNEHDWRRHGETRRRHASVVRWRTSCRIALKRRREAWERAFPHGDNTQRPNAYLRHLALRHKKLLPQLLPAPLPDVENSVPQQQ